MKDKDARLFTLIYAGLLGSLCALLLSAAGAFTAPYRAANARAEEVRHILGVLGVAFPSDAQARDLVRIFEQQVEVRELGELTVFGYSPSPEDDAEPAVALPLAGPGLWGPIKGFLALEADMATIRGVTFHEQEETPGLGGEIGSHWFRAQFKGKRIVDADGRGGIRIVRGGGAQGANEVDGITGATMTCDKVQAILNRAIEHIRKARSDNG